MAVPQMPTRVNVHHRYCTAASSTTRRGMRLPITRHATGGSQAGPAVCLTGSQTAPARAIGEQPRQHRATRDLATIIAVRELADHHG
jgi:hypothetical protein